MPTHPPPRCTSIQSYATPLPEFDAEVERGLALTCQRLFDEPSPLLSIGRFRLLRTLGRGGNGVVYEAADSLRSQRVALKVMHRQGPGELYRLKREFRALADLVHPNLVALHELHVANAVAYFTMALVDGVDFLSYAARCDRDALMDAVLQLCRGVRALHAAGKLHRDLKPHNVLVSARGEVVLLDFGLVVEVAARDGSRAGTPVYVAPEQRAGHAGEHSDWYSVGVLLGQALEARRARGLADTCELEPLALQLTAAEPRARPNHRELVAAVQAASRQPRSSWLELAVRSVPMVGRDAELRALSLAFERSRRTPVLLAVRGESGTGKSALLHELGSRCETAGALVLRGRCYERESLPYKTLDALVDALSQHLMSLSNHARAAIWPERCEALTHAFPVLGRFAQRATTDRSSSVDSPELASQLRELFRRLSAQRPLVVMLDDVQWSDYQSGGLLSAILCHRDAPALLVVMTDDADRRSTSPVLAEFARAAEHAPRPIDVEELALTELDHAAATELVEQQLCDWTIDRALARRVADAGRGSPRLIGELALFVARELAGARTPGAISIARMFRERSERVGHDGLLVLGLLALAQRPVPRAVVLDAADMLNAGSIIDDLRHARLLRLVLHGQHVLLVLQHPQFGELVRAELDASAQRRLHARLARAYLRGERPCPATLVDHYAGAALPRMAAAAAARAAIDAHDAGDFARAAQLYTRALELADNAAPDALRWREALAGALERAGDGDAALHAYQTASALSVDPMQRVQLQGRMIVLLMQAGRSTAALAMLRECYRTLGLRWPTTRLALMLAIVRLMLRAPVETRAHVTPALRSARIVFTGVVGTALENHDLLHAIYNTLCCLRECDASESPAERVRGKAAHGMLRAIALAPGGHARGVCELAQAADEARALDNAAHADVLRMQAFTWLLTGHPREALMHARACDERMRALPALPFDAWEVTCLIGAALCQLGELRELDATWANFAHRARSQRDLMTTMWIHLHPARIAVSIAAGDEADARNLIARQAELVRAHGSHRGLRFLHALCVVEYELGWGTAHGALHALRRHWRALRPMLSPGLAGTARQLHARVALACAEHAASRSQRRRWLLLARWHGWFLARAKSPLQRGMAQLLSAARFTMHDRRDHARRALERALPLLEAAHAKLAAASTQYCLAASAGQQAAALERLRGEGIASPERWIAWTVPGFRASP